MGSSSNQDSSHEAVESSTPTRTAQAGTVGDVPAAETDPAANALPAALIAQAESAIFGQFDPDDMSPVELRASRAAAHQNAPKLR